MTTNLTAPLTVRPCSLKGTDWGELDVLILDLPPGTGDVQLQVLQELQLSGAVAVTTPSQLAVLDTLKGIEMFTLLGVPTLAVVENLAYFVVSIRPGLFETLSNWIGSNSFRSAMEAVSTFRLERPKVMKTSICLAREEFSYPFLKLPQLPTTRVFPCA